LSAQVLRTQNLRHQRLPAYSNVRPNMQISSRSVVDFQPAYVEKIYYSKGSLIVVFPAQALLSEESEEEKLFDDIPKTISRYQCEFMIKNGVLVEQEFGLPFEIEDLEILSISDGRSSYLPFDYNINSAVTVRLISDDLREIKITGSAFRLKILNKVDDYESTPVDTPLHGLMKTLLPKKHHLLKYKGNKSLEILTQVLDRKFKECDALGYLYSKREVLGQLDRRKPSHIRTYGHWIRRVGENSVQLSYKVKYRNENEKVYRHDYRSSIWSHDEEKWYIVFLQSTPCDSP